MQNAQKASIAYVLQYQYTYGSTRIINTSDTNLRRL